MPRMSRATATIENPDMECETPGNAAENTVRFLRYLQLYANKQLDDIALMLADDVRLRDWNISVHGKAAALAETRKNFTSSISIAIEPLHVYAGRDGVAGELRIVVDGSTVLHVVDALTFNTAGQITSIRAYIGRDDG